MHTASHMPAAWYAVNKAALPPRLPAPGTQKPCRMVAWVRAQGVAHWGCFGHTLPALTCVRSVCPPATIEFLDTTTSAPPLQWLNKIKAPRWLFRTVACIILGGQVMARIAKGGCLVNAGPETSALLHINPATLCNILHFDVYAAQRYVCLAEPVLCVTPIRRYSAHTSLPASRWPAMTACIKLLPDDAVRSMMCNAPPTTIANAQAYVCITMCVANHLLAVPYMSCTTVCLWHIMMCR